MPLPKQMSTAFALVSLLLGGSILVFVLLLTYGSAAPPADNTSLFVPTGTATTVDGGALPELRPSPSERNSAFIGHLF